MISIHDIIAFIEYERYFQSVQDSSEQNNGDIAEEDRSGHQKPRHRMQEAA